MPEPQVAIAAASRRARAARRGMPGGYGSWAVHGESEDADFVRLPGVLPLARLTRPFRHS